METARVRFHMLYHQLSEGGSVLFSKRRLQTKTSNTYHLLQGGGRSEQVGGKKINGGKSLQKSISTVPLSCKLSWSCAGLRFPSHRLLTRLSLFRAKRGKDTKMHRSLWSVPRFVAPRSGVEKEIPSAWACPWVREGNL